MNHHSFACQQNILDAYQQHMCQVVGLAPKTCHDRGRHVSQFLEAVEIRRITDLTRLTSLVFVSYLTARSGDYEPASLRKVASSLRDFLRFTHQQGWTADAALAEGVPKIAGGAHNDLPAYLSDAQLSTLLTSWDRTRPNGVRDLAIGLCVARLGLRAGEVAALRLEDLRWRQGTVRLPRSKNGGPADLPLLSEVGEALADYLRTGRPVTPHRQVFVFGQPPRPLSPRGIGCVIARALRRCDIEVPHPGSHVLRHTLASHLVQKGATLKEVADVLRHRDLNSAEVYAHVDVPHLRCLAQPWPVEATR